MAGAWLAGLMVVMGVAATVFAIRYKFIPSFFPPTIFLVLNLLGILTFGGLVAGGIALRRNAEWHKRLMLCATISILGPGLGRLLPMDSFGAAAPLVMFAAILLFAVAGPIADLLVRKRVHPAYGWGVAAIALSNLLVAPLALTPSAQMLLRLLQSR